MNEEKKAALLSLRNKTMTRIRKIRDPALMMVMINMIGKMQPFLQNHVMDAMQEKDYITFHNDLILMGKVKKPKDALKITEQYRNVKSTPATQRAWDLVHSRPEVE